MQHAQGRYRPPQDLEYNEFVGELRPADGLVFTEMHFRYGVRNDQYLDWSVTLNARLGGVQERKGRTGPLERRKIEVVDVSDSAIRRHVFDPDEPTRPPVVTRLVELHADDYDTVDYEYQNQINHLCVRWQTDHPEIVEVSDPHNTAIMGFLAEDRDINFRDGKSYGWVRNTVVGIDTDRADMVIADRGYHYFPKVKSTAAVLLPDGVMKFIWASPGEKPSQDQLDAADASQSGPIHAKGDVTMGMIVASIYAGDDWTDQVDDLLG
jgi:hypothetical protein